MGLHGLIQDQLYLLYWLQQILIQTRHPPAHNAAAATTVLFTSRHTQPGDYFVCRTVYDYDCIDIQYIFTCVGIYVCTGTCRTRRGEIPLSSATLRIHEAPHFRSSSHQHIIFKPSFESHSLKFFVGSEVLTEVVMKNSTFSDISPCSPLRVNWRFGGIRQVHLHAQRITKQPELLATHFIIFRAWKWRQYFTPKRRWTPAEIHTVTFRKTVL
jgi:hypothetical protein